MIQVIKKPLSRTGQSQIQDFPKEGARFRVKCHVDAIQWGGGVVAEFFRDLKNPMRFSGGGGVVVAEFFLFRDLKTSISVNGALFFFFFFPKGARAQNFSFP